MSESQRWPQTVWLIRHGQSAGNVAREAAEAAGAPMIQLEHRDVDVPLSPLGEQQAEALGRWFGAADPGQRPEVVLASPYLRAEQTAHRLLASAGLSGVPVVIDERLREKEFGVFDRLTRIGIQARFPELAQMRNTLGKFYHRPPGGESWCDVILRLRSVIDTLMQEYRRGRVMILAHQVVVLSFRYLFERMPEKEILEIDRQADVANCGVTRYDYQPLGEGKGRLALQQYNFVAPLEQAGAKVTVRPDVPIAPK